MYHVALAVQADDDHLEDKLDAIAGLPDATGSVEVTVVHVHDGETAVGEVPAVANALEDLGTAGVETAVRGVVDEDPTRGLLDAVADMTVDVICIGGRRRSPAGKRQLKPGAQAVLLRAQAPVLVAGELESRKPRV